MPEPDFAGLREQLEREVRQPEFALIRARRVRRTAWWAATGAVVALVVTLVGAGWRADCSLRKASPGGRS